MFCRAVVLFQILQGGTTFSLGWAVAKIRIKTLQEHSRTTSHCDCEGAQAAKEYPSRTPMACILQKMSENVIEKMPKLFNIAYFVAREEAPFTMFPNIDDIHLTNGLSQLCPGHRSIYEGRPGGETKTHSLLLCHVWLQCRLLWERPGDALRDICDRWQTRQSVVDMPTAKASLMPYLLVWGMWAWWSSQAETTVSLNFTNVVHGSLTEAVSAWRHQISASAGWIEGDTELCLQALGEAMGIDVVKPGNADGTR